MEPGLLVDSVQRWSRWSSFCFDVFTPKFNINSEDIIANQAPFDFDVSVKDIYSSIKEGATLVIVPKRFFSKPTELLDYLYDNKNTYR